jgi:hypothetical protein
MQTKMGSVRGLLVLGLGVFGALSGCASRRDLGFAITEEPTAPPEAGAPAPDPAPGTFKLDDAGVNDADAKVVDGCHLATLGEPAATHPADVFSTWLDASGGTKGATSLKNQVLTKSLLAPYKMIVAQDVSGNHAYTPAEVAELEDWVRSGGGLVVLNGYHGGQEMVNANRLLAPFGMSFGTSLILYGGGVSIPVTNWYPHPITTGITKIGVDNGFEVLGTAPVLATEQGFDVLRATDAGSGHVIAWGDEWITYNSEWSAHPDYQVQKFWQNIVDWFSPGAGCKVPDPPPPK